MGFVNNPGVLPGQTDEERSILCNVARSQISAEISDEENFVGLFGVQAPMETLGGAVPGRRRGSHGTFVT